MFTSAKKKHFKYRLAVTERQIWDMEFQREKLRYVREGIRQQYDRLNEQNTITLSRLEEEKKKGGNKDTVKNLEALLEKYKPDLEYLKKQIEGLDNEIEGENNPKSSTQQIEGLRTLKEMIKDYIKTL